MSIFSSDLEFDYKKCVIVLPVIMLVFLFDCELRFARKTSCRIQE